MKFISVIALTLALAVAAAAQSPVEPYESAQEFVATSELDKLVLNKLRLLHIQPAYLCSDAVFVRRVYLDVIGTLPTAEDARRFIADANPSKRSILIDALLERDEFADYVAMKWCDVLRVKAEFPINLWPNAVQAYHHWIRASLRDNMPYDRFARELLTSSGSDFRVPQVNFYRALQSRDSEAIAQAAALAFMGERIQGWPAQRRADMAAFFANVAYKNTLEWKEEIIYYDPSKSAPQPPSAFRQLTLPDGTRTRVAIEKDPREAFADWLVAPDNPSFARNAVNRVWYWLLGRGIIHEPDDIRPDNPPSNPPLLNWLEKQFVASHYDLKQLYRLILNSQTYQLSSIGRSEHPAAEAQFAAYPLRRLDAEVLIDALCQVSGTDESYTSPVPEPFTFIPKEQRSIALADGSISSSFLEMYGRPPRDTGMLAERNGNPSAAQRLHLLNSSHVRKKIEQGKNLRELARSTKDPRAKLDDLYLTILSRYPTAQERETFKTYTQANPNKGEVFVDLAWALINSAEFQYRH